MSSAIKRAHPGDNVEKGSSLRPDVDQGAMLPSEMGRDAPITNKDKLVILQRRVKCIDRIVIDRARKKLMLEVFEKRQNITLEIPQFWMYALLNHPLVQLHAQHIADQVALRFLKDIWVKRDVQEPRCFTIQFFFENNPFFSDNVLEKAFRYVASNKYEGRGDLDTLGLTVAEKKFSWKDNVKPEPTDVHWKSDKMNLTKLFPRILNDEDPAKDPIEPGSFFNWFEQKLDPFHIGLTIANDIFPDAIDHARSDGYKHEEDYEDPDDPKSVDKGKSKSMQEDEDGGAVEDGKLDEDGDADEDTDEDGHD